MFIFLKMMTTHDIILIFDMHKYIYTWSNKDLSYCFPLLTENNSEHLCCLSLLLLRQPAPRPLFCDTPSLPASAALPPSLTALHAVLQGGGTRHQGGSCDA